MDESDLGANMAELDNLLESERERSGQGLGSAPSPSAGGSGPMGPPPQGPSREPMGPPAASGRGPTPGPSFMSPPPGYMDHSFCHPDFLEDFRTEIPHLGHMPDGQVLRTKLESLLKMESNAIKRFNMDKGRNTEDKLQQNQDASLAATIHVPAGTDDRNSFLHSSRFMPAPVCSGQELWLQAREVVGPTGYPPVASFDMACVEGLPSQPPRTHSRSGKP